MHSLLHATSYLNYISSIDINCCHLESVLSVCLKATNDVTCWHYWLVPLFTSTSRLCSTHMPSHDSLILVLSIVALALIPNGIGKLYLCNDMTIRLLWLKILSCTQFLQQQLPLVHLIHSVEATDWPHEFLASPVTSYHSYEVWWRPALNDLYRY